MLLRALRKGLFSTYDSFCVRRAHHRDLCLSFRDDRRHKPTAERSGDPGRVTAPSPGSAEWPPPDGTLMPREGGRRRRPANACDHGLRRPRPPSSRSLWGSGDGRSRHHISLHRLTRELRGLDFGRRTLLQGVLTAGAFLLSSSRRLLRIQRLGWRSGCRKSRSDRWLCLAAKNFTNNGGICNSRTKKSCEGTLLRLGKGHPLLSVNKQNLLFEHISVTLFGGGRVCSPTVVALHRARAVF